jgi:hypothetical protein
MSAAIFGTDEELQAFLESLPVISQDETVQGFYISMRIDGQCHNMASILALRRPPGTSHTDRAFQQGGEKMVGGLGSMPPMVRKARMAMYQRLTGKSIPSGYVYSSTMARFPGDPMAWVADVGELKQRAKQLGKGCEELGVSTPDTPPPKKVKMDEELVQRNIQKAIAKPEHAGKDVKTIREEVIEKHAYKAGVE